jgi:hypothetical protein
MRPARTGFSAPTGHPDGRTAESRRRAPSAGARARRPEADVV